MCVHRAGKQADQLTKIEEENECMGKIQRLSNLHSSYTYLSMLKVGEIGKQAALELL